MCRNLRSARVLGVSLLGLVACNEAPAPEGADLLLRDVSRERGLDWRFERAGHGLYYMPDSMGAGCALFDADGDGDLDVYAVHGVWRASDGGRNRLFLQEADGNFRDASAGSGADDEGYGMGVAVGDIDRDGDLDLYVTNVGPDRLLRNRGDGTFEDVSESAGIGNSAWAASACFLDFDVDGHLDLYVTNYLDLASDRLAGDPERMDDYPGPIQFEGVADVLLRGRGDGTFEDVSEELGINELAARGLGLVPTDLDRDGRLDVYVCNDGEDNHAWIQQADGSFENQALALGLARNKSGGVEASMGVALGDLDDDGFDELVLTHLVRETHTAYSSSAARRWRDRTGAFGLASPSLDVTGFGACLGDLDLDGDLDLLVANGGVLRREGLEQQTAPTSDLSAHWRPYAEPDHAFLNVGGRFELLEQAGDFGAHRGVGRGLVLGDVDRDGDLDLLLSEGSGRLRFYENRTARAGHWLALRAVDPALRGDALGAELTLESGSRSWRRGVRRVQSYLCSGPAEVHVGLGEVARIDAVRVRWPDGEIESFAGGQVDRSMTLTRGQGQ